MARKDKPVKEKETPVKEVETFDETPLTDEELADLTDEEEIDEDLEEETEDEDEPEVKTKVETKTVKDIPVDDSVDAPVRFRKEGGGCLRIGGKLIKPGQEFSERLSVIPKAFLTSLTRLDGGSMEVTEKRVKKETLFALAPGEGDKFLVINIKTKKPITTLSFPKDEAEEMVKALNA